MDIPSAALKTETEALCLDIELLNQNLAAKTITFDQTQQRWNSTYRPKAHILAEAMLPCVPEGDPLIVVVYKDGNGRSLASDALICIETPLLETIASTHLGTVLKYLRELAKNLPTSGKA